MGKFSGKKCRLLSMLWLTTLFFFVEIVVGYITNSMSLVADSFHMLSDVAALVVAFLSVKVGIFKALFIFPCNLKCIDIEKYCRDFVRSLTLSDQSVKHT